MKREILTDQSRYCDNVQGYKQVGWKWNWFGFGNYLFDFVIGIVGAHPNIYKNQLYLKSKKEKEITGVRKFEIFNWRKKIKG